MLMLGWTARFSPSSKCSFHTPCTFTASVPLWLVLLAYILVCWLYFHFLHDFPFLKGMSIHSWWFLHYFVQWWCLSSPGSFVPFRELFYCIACIALPCLLTPFCNAHHHTMLDRFLEYLSCGLQWAFFFLFFLESAEMLPEYLFGKHLLRASLYLVWSSVTPPSSWSSSWSLC